MTYIKKLILFSLAAALLFSFGAAAAPTENNTETAIICVEAFTVGGDFIFQPTEVAINGTSTISDLLNDYVGRNAINFGGGAGSEIRQFAVSRSDLFTVNENIVNAFNRRENEKENEEDRLKFDPVTVDSDWLRARDFTLESCWVIIVNNKASTDAPDVYRPKNGDVIRFAFSVFGNGADLALSKSNMPSTSTEQPISDFPETNRDELYKAIASYNATSEFIINYNIISTAANLSSTQNDIDRALAFMNDDYDEIDPVDYFDDDDDDDNDDEIEDDDPDFIPTDPEDPGLPGNTATTPPQTTPPPDFAQQPQTTPATTSPTDTIPQRPTAPTGASIFGALPLIGVLGGLLLLSKRRKK